MTVWLTRAGRHGAQQEFALDNNIVVHGESLPSLTSFQTKEDLEKALQAANPNAKPRSIKSWVGQEWSFSRIIKRDDLVILPLKGSSSIAVGKVIGHYEYKPNNPEAAKHVIPVHWIVKDLPRSRFDQDLLYSFGAISTVCQIRRNNAEERIKAVLNGPPGKTNTVGGSEKPFPIPESLQPEEQEDFGENALIQIRNHIGQKFAGHKLADLVEALLKAQGYQTEKSPPGPDGGVDIIAGQGPMGFNSPRMLVQVKSGDQQQDVKVARELQGVMKQFNAEHGLLVSWGGFKRTILQEQRNNFFTIRLWDDGDLVEAILKYYDSFPEDIKAELPLKRIWTLVLEE